MSQSKSPLFNNLLNELSSELFFLSDKPEETPESTLKALWLMAAGEPLSAIKALETSLPKLTSEQQETLLKLLQQRKNNIPLAHLTKRQSFMGIEMLADKRALIPRKETEILGKKALELSHLLAKKYKTVRVLDICCGAGNLGLALAYHNHNCQVWCSDLTDDAVALCLENIEHLNFEHAVKVQQGDLFSAYDNPSFHQNTHLIVCNPPYITSSKVAKIDQEIADNEPNEAFDGGMLGINVMMRLLNEAARFMTDDGWLAFELGAGQGQIMQQIMKKTGLYENPLELVDESGTVRVLITQKCVKDETN
ncbi:MAG: HemK family protein methyltransferase [Carboxylicivirga sp.]|jgi:release factor glutamine methyltransferase|nr:HemK family protein methyltransferase [Carboxylicivirga sp.]